MKALASFTLFIVALLGHAGAKQTDARDVTVHLFSTASVTDVSVDASRATMQLCAKCRPVSVPPHLPVRVAPDDAHELLIGGQKAVRVILAGELRLKTVDGRTAAGAGRWVLRVGPDGLLVSLSLPSERYVMAVLQSEAGPNDDLQALKALAVVARSFAMMHPERHGVEGLCDSTHCQAAHFGQVPDRIREAVFATAGETLWYGTSQVDGYFTQNCGGQAADAGEVWGGVRKPWLRTHADPYCRRDPGQWHASITGDELLRALETEGFHVSAPLENLRATAEDGSGRVAKITISGDGGSRALIPASALRFAVNRELGWNRLRSDWYRVHLNGREVVFDGRGYGHGVGLCQAGAAEMAHEGKSYREILAFYFAGTQVRVSARDAGWQTQQANGWTLRTTINDPGVVRAGDAAWADARKRWNAPTNVHPFVTAVPDTELFRQLTDEPGWALASTQGQGVTVQPIAVVRAHGDLQALLHHEFLHTIVEAERSASAPLWLREGFVEVLAGEKGSRSAMKLPQVEHALSNAANLREAQLAHHGAAAIVQKMIAKYGLENVRGWLRNGVPAGMLAGQ